MTESYIKFEVSEDVVSKTYEALKRSKQNGRIKKGINEVTKSVERGLAMFVVMAEDIQPPEVALHLPQLCEQKKIPYSYAKDKLNLGRSIGLNVPCAAVAVENPGDVKDMINEIISKITGKASSKPVEQKKPESKTEDKKESSESEVTEQPEQKAEERSEPVLETQEKTEEQKDDKEDN